MKTQYGHLVTLTILNVIRIIIFFQPKHNFRPTKFRHSRTKSSPSKFSSTRSSLPPVVGIVPAPTSTPKSTTTSLASTSNDGDDIYMKVKALRLSVQEVNAIIETERSVKSGKFDDVNTDKDCDNMSNNSKASASTAAATADGSSVRKKSAVIQSCNDQQTGDKGAKNGTNQKSCLQSKLEGRKQSKEGQGPML